MRLAFALLAVLATQATALIPYKPIHGLVAAVYTPFDENLQLDTSVVEAQAKKLNETGVFNILVAGTTGESVKLTQAERKELAEAWMKVAPTYGIRVLVHVGTNALPDARELAKHAESIGASGIVSMSTTYFRPATVDQLVTELASIFSAAPTLPAWYYHIPSATGDNFYRGFDMHELLVANNKSTEDGGAAIPNLIGIKFTDYDIYTFKRCIDYADGAFNLLYGRDEQLLGAVAMGAVGGVGSTYNFDGKWANGVIDSFHAGNISAAQAYQEKLVQLVAIYGKPEYAGTDPGKEIMNLLGVPVGPPRLPSAPMTTAQRTQLKADIEAIGLLG